MIKPLNVIKSIMSLINQPSEIMTLILPLFWPHRYRLLRERRLRECFVFPQEDIRDMQEIIQRR